MSGEDVSVTVAVRVRPFNEREKNMGEKLCVAMDGSTTKLTTPEKGEKTFSYDFSFWSHDEFVEDENGVYQATSDKYATQELVFSKIGVKVLDRAWQGYHCCLFAYGQTGAGKSYSMVGYGANRGIVPISCAEIFRRIDLNKDPDLSYEVTVSMLEIYNEKVQDLLCNPKDRPQGGLELRENKQLGVYVQGMAVRAVDSYEAIEQVVDHGTQNRTVASTLMNATSSRAHTVLLIDIKQISRKGDLTGVKHSTTYLVDLAGSEKTSKTAASGDRLKEGCAINKSLTCLGNVIEKLADKSQGKAVSAVPYRDSKLTRLLQNALGGSCMTVMIVAISPAGNNYEESLSTLRYADRAKKIKNVVQVNENPQDRLIRQLREENAKLLEMVDKHKSDVPSAPADSVDAKKLESTLEAERKRYEAEVAERAAEVKALEEALATMQQDFKERVKESRKTMEKTVEPLAKNSPHFSNLHEDSQLTGKLHYMFPKDKEIVLGKKPAKDSDPAPDIILAGLGVYPNHCKVVHKEDGVFLSASAKAVATTFVNGDNFPFNNGADSVKLTHGDRVVMGQNYVFVYSEGKGETGEQLIRQGKVSFDGAKKELCEKQGDIQMKSEEELRKEKEREKEFERRLEAAHSAKLKIQQEAESLIIEREREFKEKMELMQKQFESLAVRMDSAEARREVNEMRSTRERFFGSESPLRSGSSGFFDAMATRTFTNDLQGAMETLDSAPVKKDKERVVADGAKVRKGETLELVDVDAQRGSVAEAPAQPLETLAEAPRLEREAAVSVETVGAPAEAAATPAEAVPIETVPAPSAETAAPPAETVPPPEETEPAPAKTAPAPTETAAPPAETVAPPAETVASPAETAAPPAEAVAPPTEAAEASTGRGTLLPEAVPPGVTPGDATPALSEAPSTASKLAAKMATGNESAEAADRQHAWANEQKVREEEWAAERARRELELKKMQAEFEERQKNAEKEARQQLEEIERKSRILTEKAEEGRMHDLDQARINEQLLVVLPMVKEANAISKELKRNIHFKPQLWVEPDERGHFNSEIRVSVVKKPENVLLFTWPQDTVENRLFLMRELLEEWCNDPSFDANSILYEEDPFWDPFEGERYLGCARLFLESLTWELETEVEARIIGADGQLNDGSLQLEVWPLDANDQLGVQDADAIAYPEDLLDTRGAMKFLLGVNQYVGASKELEDIRCEYQYRYNNPKSFHATRNGLTVDFKFEEIISEPNADAELLDFFTYKPLYFRLFGTDKRRRTIHEAWTESLSEAQNIAPDNGLNVPRGKVMLPPLEVQISPSRSSMKLSVPVEMDMEDTITSQNAGEPLWDPRSMTLSPSPTGRTGTEVGHGSSTESLDATLMSVSGGLWSPPNALDESIVSAGPLWHADHDGAEVMPSLPELDIDTVPHPADLAVPYHGESYDDLGHDTMLPRIQEGTESAPMMYSELERSDYDLDEQPVAKNTKKWSVRGMLGSKSSDKYKQSSKSSKACVIQ